MPEFDNEVELVISDNCSDDNTEEVVEQVIRDFPDKNIKYFRNAQNVKDKNFFLALQRAKGVYRRIQNDYIYFFNDDIRNQKRIIKSLMNEKGVSLFFYFDLRECRTGKTDCLKLCNVDQFVRNVNNKQTWISHFGCFEWQLKELEIFNEKSNLMLLQMMWALHLVDSSVETIIYNIRDYKSLSNLNVNRVNYDFFVPHIVYYYAILQKYVGEGKIEFDTIKFDKTQLLKGFVGQKVLDFLLLNKNKDFNISGGWRIVFKYFWMTPYLYYILFLRFPKKFIEQIIK